jgi:Histidine kinase
VNGQGEAGLIIVAVKQRASAHLQNSSLRQWSWTEAVLPVRLGPANLRTVLLRRRQGGQRYLSVDLDALARVASEIAGRIDEMQRQEMKRLVTQAELRALQSQINPHFWFNALNTLYGMEAFPGAPLAPGVWS